MAGLTAEEGERALAMLQVGILSRVIAQQLGRKEGNVLFNDALNTFYLRLYGVGHMIMCHSDSERGNPLPHMGYSFRLAASVLLYAHDSTYNGLC